MTNTKLIREPVAKTGIRRIDIDPARSQSPTLGGLSFGSVGQYEKLRGTAYGELDPSDPRNAVITDIQLAPVNARGYGQGCRNRFRYGTGLYHGF